MNQLFILDDLDSIGVHMMCQAGGCDSIAESPKINRDNWSRDNHVARKQPKAMSWGQRDLCPESVSSWCAYWQNRTYLATTCLWRDFWKNPGISRIAMQFRGCGSITPEWWNGRHTGFKIRRP